jgi:transcriptional regulator with XRE-family HTH domain
VARFDHEISAACAAQLVSEYGRRHRVVGERMRQARRAAGCTQQRLAAELGIPLSRLSQYELGLSPIPPRLLLRMADYLDLPATDEEPRGRMH